MNYTRKNIPKRFQPVLAEAVRIMCDYINNLGDPLYRYAPLYRLDPEEYLDPERNYGETRIDFVHEDSVRNDEGERFFGITYIEAYAGIGDDGGPSHLFILADRDWHYEQTGRQNPKYPDQAELRVVTDDTYSIESIVHEFDTNYISIYPTYPEPTK